MLSWCGRPSYPHSFMPVRAGPLQQNSKEWSKPLRWDAVGDAWTFPTKTMWRTRRFAAESRMEMECMMISNHGEETHGHFSRSFGMATILQGTVKGARLIGSMAKTFLQGTEKWARLKRIQKKRWTEHQRIDRSGFWSFPDGSRRQGKVEMYCCNIICGARRPSSLRVRYITKRRYGIFFFFFFLAFCS